jgi:hypothetical protein
MDTVIDLVSRFSVFSDQQPGGDFDLVHNASDVVQ